VTDGSTWKGRQNSGLGPLRKGFLIFTKPLKILPAKKDPMNQSPPGLKRKDERQRMLLNTLPGTKAGTGVDPLFQKLLLSFGERIAFAFWRHGFVICGGKRGGDVDGAISGFASDEALFGSFLAALLDALCVVQAEPALGLFDLACIFVLLLVALKALGFEDGEDLLLEINLVICSGGGQREDGERTDHEHCVFFHNESDETPECFMSSK
jgi:hypothetical protein